MSESTNPHLDGDLEAEIEAALGDQSIREIEAEARRTESPLDEDINTGRIVDVSDMDVLVEFSAREQGVCPIGQFSNPPKVGESHPFRIEGHDDASGLAQLSLPRHAASHARWADITEGRVVKAKVTGHNSGGLELELSGHRAFMPISQINLDRVEDHSVFEGQVLECEVIELNREREKVVLSRRILLERRRDESRSMMAQGLVVGSVVRGTVTRLEPYGAFVDLGGAVEGLLHVSQMAWTRVENPEEVVELGQDLEVQVLSVEQGGFRIGLGLKQLIADPWLQFRDEHEAGLIVPGKVTRIVDFGAFVELTPGVEGLLHISQMATFRVSRVRILFTEGDEVQVRIAEYDEDRRRIGLSRLTEKGRSLDDESEADDETVGRYVKKPDEDPAARGTSLGDLLKQAMKTPPEEES